MRLVTLGACVAGGIAVAVAGYTGYWFIAAGEIEGRIDAWAERQRAQGLEIESEGTDVAGFPFRFEVSLHEPRIRDTRNGWRWSAGGLRAEALAWDFGEVTVFPDRRNSVEVLLEGDRWRTIDAEIEDGRLVVGLDESRRFEEVTVDLTGLEVVGLWPQGPARVGSLQANGISLGDGAVDDETLQTTIAVRDVVLPSDLAEGLGDSLAFLDIDASVVGPIPSERGTSEAITAWRDAGGTLELTDFRIRWGPLGIESSGTIALDGGDASHRRAHRRHHRLRRCHRRADHEQPDPPRRRLHRQGRLQHAGGKARGRRPTGAALGAGDGAGRDIVGGDGQGRRAAAAAPGVGQGTGSRA